MPRYVVVATFGLSSLAMGAVGLAWSDWFLLAGAVGAASSAAWFGTQPTNS